MYLPQSVFFVHANDTHEILKCCRALLKCCVSPNFQHFSELAARHSDLVSRWLYIVDWQMVLVERGISCKTC